MRRPNKRSRAENLLYGDVSQWWLFANLVMNGVIDFLAQRVMDCGDAGRILLSQHVADDLIHSRQWASRLRDLGECEVKHGAIGSCRSRRDSVTRRLSVIRYRLLVLSHDRGDRSWIIRF
jgi:hypothetical protein